MGVTTETGARVAAPPASISTLQAGMASPWPSMSAFRSCGSGADVFSSSGLPPREHEVGASTAPQISPRMTNCEPHEDLGVSISLDQPPVLRIPRGSPRGASAPRACV